jgi:hypothetical protein
MPDSKLLKLKTDLKSLKFDPNNEPYILFPIGYTKSFEVNDNIPQSITDFYLSNRTNPDFPLRGGTISVDPRTLTFTQASQIDKERIKKFLNDKPKGTVFLQKQVGLQLSNPKIETDGVIPGAFSGLENTRFYNNGINTLAQVGVQGTGLHAVRHGAIPFNPLQKGYYETVNLQNSLNSSETNRLVALKSIKLSNNVSNRNVASRLGIAPGSQNLFQYLGGPDSVYGVGLTTIRRYDNTEQGVSRMAVGTDAKLYSDAVKRTYRQIEEVADSNATVSNGIQTYKTSDLSVRFGVGDPGNNSSIKGTRVDRLNSNVLLYYNSSTAPWEVDSNLVYNKDIIKFVFEAIDNDNTSNATAVFFRAFLSGITDNHAASINSFRYLGRGEEFFTYQGASRQIGFSFKINPQSAEEFRPLYKKLNYLISQVYPDYSQRNKIMRAPLMRLTIGDYFYRLPGLIENISITIDDNVPWEIESNDSFKQLPHVINVQCTFKPIHDFLPRREKYSSTLDSRGFTQKSSIISDLNVPFITDDKSNFVNADILDNTLKINQSLNLTATDDEINSNFLSEFPRIDPNINLANADREINNRFSRITPVGRQRVVRRTRDDSLRYFLTDSERDALSQQPYDPPFKGR